MKNAGKGLTEPHADPIFRQPCPLIQRAHLRGSADRVSFRRLSIPASADAEQGRSSLWLVEV